MKKGISPVIATTLLIAIAVIASVTVWYWVSSYTSKPPLVQTALKVYSITNIYKNSSGDGCGSVEFRNSGASPINNVVFELRDYASGRPVGPNGTNSAISNWSSMLGLAYYWDFDRNVSKNTAGDSNSSFYGEQLNNGTYYGESFLNGNLTGGVQWIDGKYGTALQFNGANGYVWLGGSVTLQASPVSLSAWFKTTQSSNSILYRWRLFGLSLSMAAGRVSFGGYNTTSASFSATSTSAFNDGNWHHALGTYSGQIVSLYIDGELVNSAPAYGPVYYAAGGAAISRDGDSSGAYFQGAIDSFRLWNRSLNQSEAQAEMNSPYPVIRPIASWEFDDGTGTVANDTHIWVAGKYRSALNFVNTTDYVNVGDSSSLKGMTNLTISAWIYPGNYMMYSGIIGKWSSGMADRQHYILGYFSGGNTWFWVGNNSATDNIVAVQPPVGSWTHVAAVFRGGSSLEIYYNGTLQNSKSTTIPNIGTNAENLYIGRYSGYIFNGTVDSVRVWDRSLSQAEIQAEMNSARPVVRPIGAWEFDEGSGTRAEDTHMIINGKFNGGLSMDGVDDYLNVSPASAYLSGNYTITGWFNANSIGVNNDILVATNITDDSHGILIELNSNQIRFLHRQPPSGVGGDNMFSSTQVLAGTWHHFAVVRGNMMQIYINGTKANEITPTASNFVYPLMIIFGKLSQTQNTRYYNGTIDDVAIFNRSLTESEIQNIYSSGQYALDDAPSPFTAVYINISEELAPGDSRAYNISFFGNAINKSSVPPGAYILRVSSAYTQSPGTLSDRVFTCA